MGLRGIWIRSLGFFSGGFPKGAREQAAVPCGWCADLTKPRVSPPRWRTHSSRSGDSGHDRHRSLQFPVRLVTASERFVEAGCASPAVVAATASLDGAAIDGSWFATGLPMIGSANCSPSDRSNCRYGPAPARSAVLPRAVHRRVFSRGSAERRHRRGNARHPAWAPREEVTRLFASSGWTAEAAVAPNGTAGPANCLKSRTSLAFRQRNRCDDTIDGVVAGTRSRAVVAGTARCFPSKAGISVFLRGLSPWLCRKGGTNLRETRFLLYL